MPTGAIINPHRVTACRTAGRVLYVQVDGFERVVVCRDAAQAEGFRKEILGEENGNTNQEKTRFA